MSPLHGNLIISILARKFPGPTVLSSGGNPSHANCTSTPRLLAPPLATVEYSVGCRERVNSGPNPAAVRGCRVTSTLRSFGDSALVLNRHDE